MRASGIICGETREPEALGYKEAHGILNDDTIDARLDILKCKIRSSPTSLGI